MLTYLEAILRIYNRYGRRDNKYRARIKILVRAWGPETFAERVEAEWDHCKDRPNTLTQAEIDRCKSFFTSPAYETFDVEQVEAELAAKAEEQRAFQRWLDRNVWTHRVPGYASVSLSLKAAGIPPGDLTDVQMEAAADLADEFSFGELRTTHNQNMVLADVARKDLFQLWEKARVHGLATPTIGTLNDIICCPGGDYCALANAKSIPVAESIQRRFDDLDYLYDLGRIDLNISGCMNACGHHHVGHIGVLGVDKKGEEYYQISLGGASQHDAAIGKILGPSFACDVMPEVIEKIIGVYVSHRTDEEEFLDTYRRIGIDPFKERVYA